MLEFKTPDDSQPVRIAIREEGEWINAYMVADALKFQKEIARIPTTAARADPEMFEAFKAMLSNHVIWFMEGIAGMKGAKVEERPA